MRKILSVAILLLFKHLLFGSSSDTTVLEITGDSYFSLSYTNQSFAVPTKMVFTNVVSTEGNIYFYGNTNLVAVSFPKLQTCKGWFYFEQNTNLVSISAPNLTSVTERLYITSNPALTQLQLCNLKEVTVNPDSPLPWLVSNDVWGNNDQITNPPCFMLGTGPVNFKLSNTSIKENTPAYSLIGRLSCGGTGNTKLTYFVTQDIFDSRFFTVRGDSLLGNKMFTYATQNTYSFNVGVINQLGQRSGMDVTIHITEDLATPDTVTVEIPDTTLPTVFYHLGFTQPTRLLFKNLVSVSGDIGFGGNVNLVEVNFPKLESSTGYFTAYDNIGLQKIIAPQLNSVGNYLTITGNKSLTDLQVCNLQHIIPTEDINDPNTTYFRISGNTDSVDYKTPLCFRRTSPNVILPKDSIRENLPANSLVGNLSSMSLFGDRMKYFLSDDVKTDNRQFTLTKDSLLSFASFDYETKNSYQVAIVSVNELGEQAVQRFTIRITDLVVEDTVTLVITDTVLPSVEYSPRTFSKPTRVLFKNLTRVNGNINLDQVVNLIEINFPLLDTVKGIVFLHANPSLLSVKAPVLKTIYDYLYVEKNSALTELNICSLSSILPTDTSFIPYYYIVNNNNLEYGSTCIKKTNVIYVPITNIIEKPVLNTVIGYFVSDAPSTDNMRYYFVDSTGVETINPDFVIRGDSVFLTKALAWYTGSNTSVDINAIRSARVQQKSASLSSLLAEKISLTVQTNLSNTARYSTQWIGLSTTPTNSAWENAANWSSNKVPDANTDVIITGGKIIIGTNAICRSLAVSNGASVTVNPFFVLAIMR